MDATSVTQDQARPEDKPDPQEPTPAHRGAGPWLLWLCLAPVIYVLSVGPACKITQALHLEQKAPGVVQIIRAVYSPLVWCAMRSPPLSNVIGWYIFTVWQVHD